MRGRGRDDRIRLEIIGIREAKRSCAIRISGGLGKSGQEVSVGVSGSFPILDGVGVGGEELKPTLDTGFMFVDFMKLLQGLVISVDDKRNLEEVLAEAIDGPDDGASFKF